MTRKLRVSGAITTSDVEIFRAGVTWNLVEVLVVNTTGSVKAVTLQSKQVGADRDPSAATAVEVIPAGTIVDNDTLEWAPYRAFYLMPGDTLEISADATGCSYHINLVEEP